MRQIITGVNLAAIAPVVVAIGKVWRASGTGCHPKIGEVDFAAIGKIIIAIGKTRLADTACRHIGGLKIDADAFAINLLPHAACLALSILAGITKRTSLSDFTSQTITTRPAIDIVGSGRNTLIPTKQLPARTAQCTDTALARITAAANAALIIVIRKHSTAAIALRTAARLIRVAVHLTAIGKAVVTIGKTLKANTACRHIGDSEIHTNAAALDQVRCTAQLAFAALADIARFTGHPCIHPLTITTRTAIGRVLIGRNALAIAKNLPATAARLTLAISAPIPLGTGHPRMASTAIATRPAIRFIRQRIDALPLATYHPAAARRITKLPRLIAQIFLRAASPVKRHRQMRHLHTVAHIFLPALCPAPRHNVE